MTGAQYLEMDTSTLTSAVWLASYRPTLQGLTSQQQHFTVSPGGYSIYSWQFSDDARTSSCVGTQPPGGNCWMRSNDARNLAIQTTPPIPRFDKWTNSRPDQVCFL